MRNIIKKYSQGRIVLVMFVTANLLYLLMLFVTIPMVMVFSGGMNLFDMIPTGYDLAYAKTLLDTLGPAGRSVYLTRQLPVDMFYPLFSAVAYCLLMAWLFKKIKLIDTPVILLCLLPLVAGMFDYLENFGIIVMIISYPGISGLMVGVVSAFSIIKSMLSALFFTILIIAFITFLIRSSLIAFTRK